MISDAVHDRVLELWATTDLSIRKIAKKVGISRGSVAAICTGRRVKMGDRNRNRNRRDDGLAVVGWHRCPRCGGLINTRACVACRAESARVPRPPKPDPPVDLELHLTPDQQARLDYVRARRRAGNPITKSEGR